VFWLFCNWSYCSLHFSLLSRDSSVDIAARRRPGSPGNLTSNPGKWKDISLFYSVHGVSGTHQAFYPMGTEGPFLLDKAAGGVKLTTHLHLVPRSRMMAGLDAVEMIKINCPYRESKPIARRYTDWAILDPDVRLVYKITSNHVISSVYAHVSRTYKIKENKNISWNNILLPLKGKVFPLQALEALRVVRGWGSHIF
jgi:hypothetical protein